MDIGLFHIQPAAPEPIYRQIMAQLRRLIASGQLAPGALLPSVRDVAGGHAINPMTVSRAYGLLENEGVLERQRGKGMVVATTHRPRPSSDQRLAALVPSLREVARQTRELKLPNGLVLERLRTLLEDEHERITPARSKIR